MEKRDAVKLRTLLVRYMLLCAAVSVCALVLFFVVFVLAINSGVVLPANTAEKQASSARDALEQAGVFDAALVPELCGYALFDRGGSVVESSLTDTALAAAARYRVTGVNNGKFFHVSARLKNGVCVLQYSFEAVYANPAVRGRLPNLELLLPILFLLMLVPLLGGITLYYTKRLRHGLAILKDATTAMARGDLEWSAAPTRIADYDEVLATMQTLQTALRDSLQKQWSMEHSRVAQMQALAHDLRTPLTVIDGNAQLLGETALDTEQAECVQAIARAGGAAQDYVATLRRIAGTPQEKPEQPEPQARQTVPAAEFLQELARDAHEICKVRGVRLCVDLPEINDSAAPAMTLCAQEVRRAVGNTVQNAAEHSPRGGAVKLALAWRAPLFTATVEDSGPGFSPQALLHAAEPLFTEHTGRAPSGHLGLGLAVAQQTAQSHGGNLRVENTAQGHGRVVLTLRAVRA